MKNMTLRRSLCLLMATLMVAGLLCGCGSSDKGGSATVEVPADPNAPYDETVTLSTYFEIAAPIMNIFSQEELENLKYTKDMEAATNIKLDYKWYAADTEDDAEQKKNTAIASGDIPDFMLVKSAQLSLLAKSDMINKDLKPIFDAYASETLKKWTYAEGDAAMDSATYGGKLIAIPLVDSSIDGAPFLWIRKDWLDNLGMSVPTTMDELYAVMKAFKENDPDGDGENDTVGMSLHKNFLTMATSDAVGVFNGFGAYPTAWIDDGNGGLMYGSVAPENKDALAFLKKAYDEGLIEADFSVKDDTKTTELIAGGKTGIQYGAMWNAMWPLNMTVANEPDADWVACPIPGTDAHPQIALKITDYVVINAECEHPEAVIKLLNFWCHAFGETSPEEYQSYLVDDGSGVPTFPQHYVMLKTWSPTKNLDAYYHVKEAMEKNDSSSLSAEELSYYNDVVAYQGGDMSKVGSAKTFAPEGSAFEAMDYYKTNDSFLMDAFTGAQTKTMASKMSIVRDKVMEYYTKVIMGSETLDNWDSFVEELNNLGLADITSEVNEWYAGK